MAYPALPAFDTGDVILRSSDNEDFLMYKLDLSRASPVFDTMFSLPQPYHEDTKDGLSVVELTEPGDVLGPLCALCLPMAIRSSSKYFESVASVAHVLEAAQKYEMEWLIEGAREVLRGWMETEPIRVYAVACRFGLREEANLAARFCLRVPAEAILTCEAEELDLLTVTQFRFLVKYRDDCQKAIEKYSPTASVGLVGIWSGGQFCPSRHMNHNRAWKTRYTESIMTTLRASTWEGAVGVEQVVAAWMEVPREELCTKCMHDLKSQWYEISRQVSRGVARVIAKYPFDVQQYPKPVLEWENQ